MSTLVSPLGSWAKWLVEGNFISFPIEGGRAYEHILQRDMAHWEYTWPEAITTETDSGPFVPADLEITRRYNPTTHMNRIWQVIFGIQTQTFIYIEMPTDTHRHGIPKDPKPSTANRRTSHFTEWMSPFLEPSFITEMFMEREQGLGQVAIDAYNPTDITLTPVLNFFIAKMDTERLGVEIIDNGRVSLQPTENRFKEVLDKLYRRVIPSRPLTLLPVRGPAAAN